MEVFFIYGKFHRSPRVVSRACVAIMGGGAALLMWRGVGSGWWLLPMVLCLGAHFLLHRTHSGHGK